MVKIKKQKAKKSVSQKRKLKFEESKCGLEAPRYVNKINQLDKNDVGSLTGNHKEFSKSNKLILKSQATFRSKKHNVFTEKIHKIAVSDNDRGIQ